MGLISVSGMLLIPCVGRCLLSRWVRVSRRRRLSTCTDSSAPHVCIVGSGPAGFYTAQQLLKVNMSPVLRKLGLMHVREVLSQIRLCSP
ncbi:hypothetical protein DPMN_025022 [Dreissena polymorpha]|uniref:NADPH:adrenodoxin oxidoreductase, mitochondrial n=1 Tax=Dreissena polymorpha TaxID=45954 RepID=A0A9D4RC65_DREPO|nr:hypothetical protein DPMN_025022 [Dreissena polymorpha]